LVLRLRDHSDASAWNEFVTVYSPLIYDFCRARGLQASDAADVTQEVLMRLSKSIRSFEYDREKGLFRDWLARIVLNEIRRLTNKATQLARRAEDLQHTDNMDGNFASCWNEQFHHHIFNQALERTRPHFTAETWSMFELSWLQNGPPEQVAKQLGVGIELIYVARSRVLKRLRCEVAALADDVI
jgi:RNA polymerase sigma-70 factor, ECF subfamily